VDSGGDEEEVVEEDARGVGRESRLHIARPGLYKLGSIGRGLQPRIGLL
jgi:hypothetical protein